MNVFIKNTQTGEQKQFKDGLKLKVFVQSITDKQIKSSDDAIQYLTDNKDVCLWCIAYQQKEKFNLNY